MDFSKPLYPRISVFVVAGKVLAEVIHHEAFGPQS
jgi:hypothetical protein